MYDIIDECLMSQFTVTKFMKKIYKSFIYNYFYALSSMTLS
jgi:hypothetical protein